MAPTSTSASSSAPLPSTFSAPQAKKAVDALIAHASKVAKDREETELISKDEHVWLNINTKSPSTKRKLMPVRIQLPHPPLPPPPSTSICLITKDPQREYKDLLSSLDIKFIGRVVGVAKLKGKFKPYEARRQLMKDHEVWLCDDRIIEQMPELLGKKFFEAKKTPIPVNLRRKDLKAELARAISSTYYHPSTGTSHAIRIATISSSTPSQTLENLLAAIPAAISRIQGEWSNVLSIGIKTNGSVLLPIWNSKLDGRFDRPETESKPVTAEDGDVDMDGVKSKKAKAKKGGEGVQKEEKTTPKSAVAVSEEKVLKKAVVAAAAPAKKAEKTEKKKTSVIGSGSAGKRAKASILGKA